MNDNQAILEGVVAWVKDVLPELVGSYDYLPAGKNANLPDVVAEFDNVELVLGGNDNRFPYHQLQNAQVIAYTLTVSLMVDNSDPESAAAVLRGFQQRLLADFVDEANLRGNVPFRSPFIRFDYTPPFVEYEDGTRGREMTMTITVGDLVEVE